MVLKKFTALGNRFLFEMYLEYYTPQMVDALKIALARYTIDDVKRMVSSSQFPDISMVDFAALAPYYQHVEKVSLERMVEDLLYPARPDLIQAVLDLGMPGATWLARFRLNFLEKIKAAAAAAAAAVPAPDETILPAPAPPPPEVFPTIPIPGGTMTEAPPKDLVKCTCDVCQNYWVIPREDAEKLTECPYCHAPTDENKPSP